MLRMPLTSRANGRAGIGSTIAIAMSLAGPAVLGTAALSSPALSQGYEPPPPPLQSSQPPQRQRQRQQDAETLSRNFTPVYQAVAEATNTTGNYAAARAQVPTLLAAIGSEYDRFFAGNILLQLGAKSTDRALQKQGLELMLASGRAGPENVGLFHYLLGGLSYDSGDYAGALRESQASLSAGYTGDFAQQRDPWGLAADAYFKLNRNQEGIEFLKSTIVQRRAAGQPVRAEWLPRALAVAFQQNMMDATVDLSAMLVETNPTPTTWMQALQVVKSVVGTDAQTRLDVFRLMALTDSLTQREEFESYIGLLDPRVLPSESGKVLEAGVDKGVFTTSDPFYTDLKRIIDNATGQEPGLAADYAGEAGSASTGRAALNAGDVYLSLGEYARAEEMFALALQKGGVDRDQVLTRLGIAQVRQQKLAEAKSTFAQISGTRGPVARMWTAYIQTRA
jgi:tetratricopeptide (TPR) repeat protein